ncbi:MAG: hypothetical protein WD969_06070 [Paracoccaceae bacterium]
MAHPVTSSLMEIKETVEHASGGELKIEICDSAQLYKDSDAHLTVSSGAVGMGASSLTLYAGAIPAVDFFCVPLS